MAAPGCVRAQTNLLFPKSIESQQRLGLIDNIETVPIHNICSCREVVFEASGALYDQEPPNCKVDQYRWPVVMLVP
jgi:hypothetical protein